MIGMAIAVATTLANHPPADGIAWVLVILGKRSPSRWWFASSASS